MTHEEYRAAIEDVIYLASCAVKGEAPDKTRVVGMDLKRLYSAADRHLLTGVTACALESAGIYDHAFSQAKAKAIRKILLFDSERTAVLRELDKAGIWYVPLKGSVLKEYYPAIWMRQMADNDILCDAARSRDIRAIMERLGFKTVQYCHNQYGHDSYDKEPVCHFEMHRSLFDPSRGALYDYYLNVKERLVKDEGNSCGYHFRDEDFYLYMIAHEYKHYSVSGTGIRSLLDTFVFLRYFDGRLDTDYIGRELKKLQLTVFEKQNRNLALHLFGGKSLTEADREMLDYILSSGTYGTTENRLRNNMKKYGEGRLGKLRYVYHRLILPIDTVKSAFPLFWKVPILLPFLPLYRGCKGLLTNRPALITEYKMLRQNFK